MLPVAIYFFQYLPPWRIDVFNALAQMYHLTIVFWNSECEGFTYDRQELLSKLDSSIETIFLNNGIEAGTHSIRRGVLRIIRSRKPQVVFSHEYAPISMQCALIRLFRLSDFKFVLTTSDNLKMAEGSAGLKCFSRDFILNHADGAILYSKEVRAWYQRRFSKLRTDVCPNIQNPQSLLSLRPCFSSFTACFRQKYGLEGQRVMLYMGRLNPVKGLDLLLPAFAKADHEGWTLVLVGEGKETDALMAQAQKLGLKNQVVFAGFYSGVELYAWYDLANFFILPSRYEPFGAVINEALILGCPVVTSQYVGALEFVSQENGMVFDPLDATSFVATLNAAMTRYAAIKEPRKNFMSVSFDKSVQAFQRIVGGEKD